MAHVDASGTAFAKSITTFWPSLKESPSQLTSRTPFTIDARTVSPFGATTLVIAPNGRPDKTVNSGPLNVRVFLVSEFRKANVNADALKSTSISSVPWPESEAMRRTVSTPLPTVKVGLV
jgi:hypothetical protein